MMINKVTLYSSDLPALKQFYVDELGFTCLTNEANYFEMKVGNSVLQFKKSSSYNKRPFYHFAFNIPSDMFNKAKEWASSRVIINKEDGVDEIYFSSWNAHSFYFLDAANNIVEFISRHSLSPASGLSTFSVSQILNISEINLTTNDVIGVGSQLIEQGLSFRDIAELNEESLNFIGNPEEGAYILLGPVNRRWIFSKQYSEIHPLSIQIDGHKNIIVSDKGTVQIRDDIVD